MTYLSWITTSIIIDISTVCFFVAFILKIKKLQSQIQDIRNDLRITMKNPQAAKRLLKERQQ